MPFTSVKPKLKISVPNKKVLKDIVRSPSEPLRKIERAKMILLKLQGETISSIARTLSTNRPKIERTINKAIEMGFEAALDDLPRSGKKPRITDDARNWLVSVACQKPLDFGYSFELWTHKLLARHIRKTCREAGFDSLAKVASGTISKILAKFSVQPHKIKYYLERRDPDFDSKMEQVLFLYKEVELSKQASPGKRDVFISYDEKPGLQAIGKTAPDLLPVPGKHSTISRDHEYERFGTVSLLAGIDLMTGHVHARVEDRHRSLEFTEFLKDLSTYYPKKKKINVLLDNHSAHISAETRRYLASVPNRFDFVFTPKHASWLNIVECFFSKMARSFLRGIRVKSKEELRERLLKYFEEINESPVVFKWAYKMDENDEKKIGSVQS